MFMQYKYDIQDCPTDI